MIEKGETYPVHKIAFKYAYEIENCNIDKSELVKALGKTKSMVSEISKAIELRKFSDRLK